MWRLNTFCILADQTIDDALRVFYASNLVSGYVIDRNIFLSEGRSFIDLFGQTTTNAFNRSLQLLRHFFNGNQVMLGFGLNFYAYIPGWKLNTSSINRVDFLSESFYIDSNRNKTCYCYLNASCSGPAYIDTYDNSTYTVINTTIVPNFYIGCSIMEGLFLSSFQCFFDQACIDGLRIFQSAIALNSSSSSRYPPDTKLNEIIENLFIEDYNSSISYDEYYSQCKPLSCTYAMEIVREPIEVFTTCLGILGGLKAILSVLVPILVNAITGLIRKCRGQKNENELNLTDINAK